VTMPLNIQSVTAVPGGRHDVTMYIQNVTRVPGGRHDVTMPLYIQTVSRVPGGRHDVDYRVRRPSAIDSKLGSALFPGERTRHGTARHGTARHGTMALLRAGKGKVWSGQELKGLSRTEQGE
jgi:hypothetical protein